MDTNYQLGGWIYVNEFENRLKFTNPSDFIPQKIENVLEASYSTPFYRNQLLTVLKRNHIIDTDSHNQQCFHWILKQ